MAIAGECKHEDQEIEDWLEGHKKWKKDNEDII